MAINFLVNQTIDNTIKFVGGGENYATLKMVSQGLEVSVGDPADTTNPLVHFDGAYERVLIGSTTAANTPYLRIGGANNQSSRLELAEETTGVGRDMNYGFSFNQTGNVSNKLEIKRHNNSTAGSNVITLARDNSTVTFAGNLDGVANMFLQDYVYHAGDGNTYFGFPTSDRFAVSAGGAVNLELVSNGVSLRQAGSNKLQTSSTGVTVAGRISGLTNPTAAQDAATKAYVDSAISGTGTVTGTGVTSKIAVWSSSTSIIDGPVSFSGNNASFAGSIAVSGTGTFSSPTDQILNLNSTDNGAVYTALKRSNTRIGYVGFGGSGSSLTFANELSGAVSISNPAGSLVISTNGSATFSGNVTTGASLISSNIIINQITSATANGNINIRNNAGTNIVVFNNDLSSTFGGNISANNSTFTGNLIAGTGNISMDGSSSGQVKINGAGYSGAIALDATAMRIYHNSSSRDLVLGTNETARLTIAGGGNIQIANSLGITGNLTVTGGDVVLGGTGRIQGIDTVSASTDAANKAYVDANSSSLSGSGAGGRVTIWSGTNILSSDTQLLFDTSTNKLTSNLFQIPNNGDYLGTDTGGSARTLISLTSGNDVEVSNSALTTGSDTIIYFGDNFRVKDGSTNRLSISSNGTMSNFGNTFNSGPINLDEGDKIVFDDDGDQWNYIYANGGSTDMAVGGTLTLLNIEENLFGDIKLENIYSIINGSTSSNATFIPVYTDSASSTVPRLLREQTPTQFLSNAGAITGSGTSGRVAFFTGTRTQSSDTLYWNSTQNALGINVNPTSGTAGHLQMPGTTNSGGKSIFINTTLSSTYGALGIDVKTPRYGSAIQLTSNQTSGSTVMKILRYTGTQVGSIVANNGSTSFNTSSDRRLKEKITKGILGAAEVLDELRPCTFIFVDPKDPFAISPIVAGFIADELQKTVPDAVSGLPLDVDRNEESPNFGQPIYQQVDTTKLIPYLTQAIKDLQTRVTSIEKRLPREPGPREFKEL